MNDAERRALGEKTIKDVYAGDVIVPEEGYTFTDVMLKQLFAELWTRETLSMRDKRILLLEGEPIGAVLRVPAEKEVRANLHVGGRAVKTSLDEDDRRIVERVGPVLRDHGLFFVGIDVIGGKLTEINGTSPTGVQEVNALDDVKLEAVFMDAVEKRLG